MSTFPNFVCGNKTYVKFPAGRTARQRPASREHKNEPETTDRDDDIIMDRLREPLVANTVAAQTNPTSSKHIEQSIRSLPSLSALRSKEPPLPPQPADVNVRQERPEARTFERVTRPLNQESPSHELPLASMRSVQQLVPAFEQLRTGGSVSRAAPTELAFDTTQSTRRWPDTGTIRVTTQIQFIPIDSRREIHGAAGSHISNRQTSFERHNETFRRQLSSEVKFEASGQQLPLNEANANTSQQQPSVRQRQTIGNSTAGSLHPTARVNQNIQTRPAVFEDRSSLHDPFCQYSAGAARQRPEMPGASGSQLYHQIRDQLRFDEEEDEVEYRRPPMEERPLTVPAQRSSMTMSSTWASPPTHRPSVQQLSDEEDAYYMPLRTMATPQVSVPPSVIRQRCSIGITSTRASRPTQRPSGQRPQFPRVSSEHLSSRTATASQQEQQSEPVKTIRYLAAMMRREDSRFRNSFVQPTAAFTAVQQQRRPGPGVSRSFSFAGSRQGEEPRSAMVQQTAAVTPVQNPQSQPQQKNISTTYQRGESEIVARYLRALSHEPAFGTRRYE